MKTYAWTFVGWRHVNAIITLFSELFFARALPNLLAQFHLSYSRDIRLPAIPGFQITRNALSWKIHMMPLQQSLKIFPQSSPSMDDASITSTVSVDSSPRKVIPPPLHDVVSHNKRRVSSDLSASTEHESCWGKEDLTCRWYSPQDFAVFKQNISFISKEAALSAHFMVTLSQAYSACESARLEPMGRTHALFCDTLGASFRRLVSASHTRIGLEARLCRAMVPSRSR